MTGSVSEWSDWACAPPAGRCPVSREGPRFPRTLAESARRGWTGGAGGGSPPDPPSFSSPPPPSVPPSLLSRSIDRRGVYIDLGNTKTPAFSAASELSLAKVDKVSEKERKG